MLFLPPNQQCQSTEGNVSILNITALSVRTHEVKSVHTKYQHVKTNHTTRAGIIGASDDT